MSTNQEASTPNKQDATRRSFLSQSAAVTGGAMAAGMTSGLPRAFAAHSSGDNRLRIGVIGCGGRGRGAIKDALAAGDDAVVVAMADAFDDRMRDTHRIVQELFGERIDVPEEQMFAGFDAYKNVLECDCDLVILATPPGFRPIHFEAAIDSGKHVFMEKPVAVDAPGIRRVLEAGEKAREKRLSVGVGLQRRHEKHYQYAVERIWDGALGDEVLYTRVYWNGAGVWTRPRKPQQTEMEYQMRNWYYFNWLCGDHITEQHIHNIDVSNWIKKGHPVRANGMGGREVRTGLDNGQIFDHHFVEFTYEDGSTMMSQCRHIPGAWSEVNEFAHGAKGHCQMNRARFFDRQGKPTDRFRGKIEAGYVQEHIDLQASIKSGQTYSETEYGAHSTMTSILGRMATYSGRVVTWEEAINSNIDLSPQHYAFDADPPVLPDSDGRYPVPVPGETTTV
jgi:myo-inositol 2-dehydrogenase/D-chiro-inositol 1-dehydrogenase